MTQKSAFTNCLIWEITVSQTYGYEMFQVHIFSTFRVKPRTRIKRENLQTAITPKLCKSELWVLGTALPHNEIHPYMKFQVHIFSTFRVMPRTRITNGNNSKIMQIRVTILLHCTLPHCHLAIFQVWGQCLLCFSSYAPDKNDML